MKRFFAVVIAMGIITLLDISGPVMSRDRCPGIEAYFILQPNQALAIHVPMTKQLHSLDNPVKYGIKDYDLCDAENAYCLKFNNIQVNNI
ncbi:uncharacterized protein [Magallana gigas]|uniref:uncharacterized protein n=1 Tax=Magallana gigas TaxID=29159 RepID=UPI0033403609